jgi:uncharacterized membrane protein
MAPNLFRFLLLLVAVYAFARGRRDERQIGIVLVTGVIATTLALSPITHRYNGLETTVMLVDIGVFAGFLWVALRSERFWPLWIAGLQLTTIIGHLLKAVDLHLFARAYGAALSFWGYPIVLILGIGTWRQSRRRRSVDDKAVI